MTSSWPSTRTLTPANLAIARAILDEIRAGREVLPAIRRHPLPEGGYLAKSVLVQAYRELVTSGDWPADDALFARLRMKPVRTLSGVTTVTVLTKPYPCPGKCIFCPTDARMPKSYLPDEPGAMRGLQNEFDPYRQVSTRLQSLSATGHPTDKIELLILGGTWSSYRRDYQEEFIRRCLDAMNGFDAATLEAAQAANEVAAHRNVGLVIETRPDEIDARELAWLRRLGVTKVQMGAQSLDNAILEQNKRGHTVEELLRACGRLRAAGFKIVLHWMPNLLGATPQSDREDFARLWSLGLCPDEIKIYPTQLLSNAELYAYWQRGEYRPYTTDELIQLIADVKTSIPVYCRVNRVIRDIPSTNVVEGNRRTSLRQDALAELARRGQKCRCIRCREVRDQSFTRAELRLEDETYPAYQAEEHFLQFVTPDDAIAGYLRLSLPAAGVEVQDTPPELVERGEGESTPRSYWNAPLDKLGERIPPPELVEGGEGKSTPRSYWNAPLDKLGEPLLHDLRGAALIREVHVYGQSLPVGAQGGAGAAQHTGLGTALLRRAEEIARARGYTRLAVIAAIGTRKYYESRGFQRGELYMVKELRTTDFDNGF